MAGGDLAGDYGGPGKPGSPQLPAQRPAGEIHRAIYRRNRDGGAPLLAGQRSRGPSPGDPGPIGRLPGASRPSSRRRRPTWGWTSMRPAPYQVPGQALGWLASPRRPVPAGLSPSPESAAGLGGRCPGSPGPGCAGWCMRCCPWGGSVREELLLWRWMCNCATSG